MEDRNDLEKAATAKQKEIAAIRETAIDYSQRIYYDGYQDALNFITDQLKKQEEPKNEQC